MISSKRQISTYRDHFGGYGENNAQSTDTSLDEYGPVSVLDIPSAPVENVRYTTLDITPQSPVATAPAEPPHADSLYTTMDSVATQSEPAVAEPFGTRTVDVPQREKREKNKLNTEIKPSANTDIKPSKKTQDSIKNGAERTSSTSRRSGTKIDPRTKVMLLVYVVIAAVLAVAVIATGVSITNSSAQTQSLYNEIATIEQGIYGQEAEIANINETMYERAKDLGMVEAGDSAGTVSKLDKVDYPDATPHSNAFDRFCKFISDMIN